MKSNFKTIFAALFAMTLMVFAMPQKAQAKYGPWTQTYKFHANYPDGTDKVITRTYDVPEQFTKFVNLTNILTPTASDLGFSYSGYKANGWNNKQYGSKQPSWIIANYDQRTYDVYAIWEEDVPETTFTLNFNGNATGVSNVPGSLTATEKKISHEFTIPENVPVLNGYIFKGWAESNTATEATVQPKEKYTVLSSAATKTLYAVWEKILLPGNLTISCEGLQNKESAVIEVKNGNSVLYRVSVSSDSPSVTIKGISVGTYTVVPMHWSWTYETMDLQNVTIEEEQTASVSFTAVKKTSIEQKYDENKKVVK